MNTDQGSQFTGAEFIGELHKHGIEIALPPEISSAAI
jgi:hypothetical protein